MLKLTAEKPIIGSKVARIGDYCMINDYTGKMPDSYVGEVTKINDNQYFVKWLTTDEILYYTFDELFLVE